MSQTIQLDLAARRIASNLSAQAQDDDPHVEELKFFDIETMIPIITTGIIMALKCLVPDDGESLKAMAENSYDETKYRAKYGFFRKQDVVNLSRGTKFANRQEGRRMTWDQSRSIAVGILEDARTQETAQLSLVVKEVDELQSARSSTTSLMVPPSPHQYPLFAGTPNVSLGGLFGTLFADDDDDDFDDTE